MSFDLGGERRKGKGRDLKSKMHSQLLFKLPSFPLFPFKIKLKHTLNIVSIVCTTIAKKCISVIFDCFHLHYISLKAIHTLRNAMTL